MLEAAREGEDVCEWARQLEGQLFICRVSPETAKAAWELGLLSEGAAEAASSREYESAYEMRAMDMPLVLLWAPVHAAVLALLGALGLGPVALVSCALAIMVATCDRMYRSIPSVPCVLMGVAGAVASSAPAAGIALFLAAAAALMLATRGRSILKGIGTGDLLLFMSMLVGVLWGGFSMVFLLVAASWFLSLLVAQRVTGKRQPIAMGPSLAGPYLLAWVVTSWA